MKKGPDEQKFSPILYTKLFGGFENFLQTMWSHVGFSMVDQ